MTPLPRLIWQTLLGLTVMLIVVVVLAWLTSSLPVGVLLGISWLFIAFNVLQRFRRKHNGL
jgi:hypothetical protein